MNFKFLLLWAHLLGTSSFFHSKFADFIPSKIAVSNQVLCFRLQQSKVFAMSAASRIHSDRKLVPTDENNVPTAPISTFPKPSFKVIYRSGIEQRIGASVSILQRTTGAVPRSSTPSYLIVEGVEDSNEESIKILIEHGLRWYLDTSGKLSSLYVLSSSAAQHRALDEMGFVVDKITRTQEDCLIDHPPFLRKESLYYRGKSDQLLAYCTAAIDEVKHDVPEDSSHATGLQLRLNNLYDIQGRLYHELNQLSQSIDSYTAALLLFPSDSHTLRNLGAAFHAKGNMQMAFASYQQAIQVNPLDPLVYLKLAFFYEDYAKKDWIDAGIHAERCYRYYLQELDPEDTTILLRLGNLLLQEGNATAAIDAYNQVLALEPSSFGAWFNRAHAQLKIQDYRGAEESLRQTLKLDPTLIAARHMLNALDEEQSKKIQRMDKEYVQQLFDQYAGSYEEHGKKLLYSAPRIIRQELANIYKERKSSLDPTFSLPNVTLPAAASDGSCTSYVSFMNSSLDILDLGCGTGLMGAWLKDYAKYLVGVDLSAGMIQLAGKKMIYQELYTESIDRYLERSFEKKQSEFDLIVAAEVFSYIGDLSTIFSQIGSYLPKIGGLFAFTVESLDAIDSRPIAFKASKGNTQESSSEVTGFQLIKSGRFAYRKSYIEELIQQSTSFRLKSFRDFSPRMDVGQPVAGYLFILERV